MSAVLSGSTVLVVEDEPFIALEVVELLETAGCRVLGPFGRLEEGLEAAEKGNFDLAVLDVKLRGAAVWPLAELLRARGVPFVFLTGYSMIENFEHVIRLDKPYEGSKVLDALSQLRGGAGSTDGCPD
jgi:CheY-like chemotaxis protein